MAPEMVFENQYNYSIDIWALGILLYELLHGYAPFGAKNLEQMKQKLQHGYYQLGSTFSKQVKSLIIEILQFDPQKRPQIQKILSHPWIEKMRKEIIGEIGQIKSQLAGKHPNRAKVDRDARFVNQKHKRFDSLANQSSLTSKQVEGPPTACFDKLFDQNGKILDDKKRIKKKCKTQGEESIQKMLAQNARNKSKRQKQNTLGQLRFVIQPAKVPTFNSSSGLGLKLKRNIDKTTAQLSGKITLDRKRYK